jgi:FkbM family methyltransferase
MSLFETSLWIARRIPTPVKSAIHRVRFLDRTVMGAYGATVRGHVPTIDAGPMRGIKLAASRHTSHAHIDGTYERDVVEAIDGMLRDGDVCYDLGASIGYMSLLMARRAMHVYAFEPAPHAAAEIGRHLAVNKVRNVTIVPSPLSDKVREVRFCVTDVAYGSAINESETRWPVLRLQAATVDVFARANRPPDFLKIDVEGEEGRVLEGATEVLTRSKPRICCELHDREVAASVLGTLGRFGYTVTLLDGSPAKIPDTVVPGRFHILARPAA